jgi:DNA-directed RNA polymerase specialized sigma24 family protein
MATMDVPSASEAFTVGAIRHGGDEVLVAAVDRWFGATTRLARALTGDAQVARRVAREAWVSTVQGIDSLDASSSFVVAVARATVERAAEQIDQIEPVGVDPDRFELESNRWSGWWRDDRAPEEWSEPASEDGLAQALDLVAPASAAVVVLRDVEGLAPEEVEAALGFDAQAQRALLQEGRTAIWQVVEAARETVG